MIKQKFLDNKMQNILITGANGQVGSEFRVLHNNYIHYNWFFSNKKELDITDKILLEKYIEDNNINIIINCAAYTNVELAQKEEEKANIINNIAVKYLAECTKKYNIKLIHISTDSVFNGKNYKPYNENDKTSPLNTYSQTKLDGEKQMIKINPKNSIIIRTSWVYSSFGNNFVKNMIRLGKYKDELDVIFDQIGTPTYAYDLAKIILDIIPNINNKKVEIYNYSNEGVLSWYDFAKEIIQIEQLQCKINPIETFGYPTLATRPHYSLLNKSKIKKDFNIKIPYWKDSLYKCLVKIRERI